VRRTVPSLFAAALLFAGAVPARAGLANPCTFDAGAATVTVVPDGGSVELYLVNGDEIWANSDPCDGADTSNTDDVLVTAASGDQVEINLATGPFAPGKTAETSGTSEIEFEITGGPALLTITGSGTADAISLTSPTATNAVNLNADEASPDGDIRFAYDAIASTWVFLGSGPDTLRAGGPAPFLGPLIVEGGVGADLIQPGWGDGEYYGDAPLTPLDTKRDTLTLTWFASNCRGVVDNDMLGIGTSFDCPGDDTGFETSLFERIVGHAGDSYIFGAAGPEQILGGGGDDAIVPGRGHDTVDGGAGWDQLVVGTFEPVHVDLAARQVFGEGREDFTGIEGVFSTNEGKDVFAGDPPAIIDSVSGGDGPNVLDLRRSDRGLTVYTSTTIVSGLVTSGLFAQGFLVMGTPFDDTMVGGPNELPSGHDEFRGLGGDDHLDGGPGPDTLLGGGGDDVIAGGTGVDTCAGGLGFDIVSACES
jgi:Ca2+-binding RTX toxin-like protein